VLEIACAIEASHVRDARIPAREVSCTTRARLVEHGDSYDEVLLPSAD